MALASVLRSTLDQGLAYALRKRSRAARIVRITATGDIGAHGPDVRDDIVSQVKAAGLAIVGYTHRWRDERTRDTWRGTLMAGCDVPEDADRALAEGWRAALVVPADTPRVTATPSGHKVVVCPAQVTDGVVTCNTCRLCDASKPGPVIGFREHGPPGQTPADYRRRASIG